MCPYLIYGYQNVGILLVMAVEFRNVSVKDVFFIKSGSAMLNFIVCACSRPSKLIILGCTCQLGMCM